jgi:hypothetical protein
MHMMNQYSRWSYCFALISFLALADAISGGLVRESLIYHKVEYTISMFMMIATVGVYAREAPPGARFIRSYSRHKL